MTIFLSYWCQVLQVFWLSYCTGLKLIWTQSNVNNWHYKVPLTLPEHAKQTHKELTFIANMYMLKATCHQLIIIWLFTCTTKIIVNQTIIFVAKHISVHNKHILLFLLYMLSSFKHRYQLYIQCHTITRLHLR